MNTRTLRLRNLETEPLAARPRATVRSRVAALNDLFKLRLNLMVLLSVAVGFYLGASGPVRLFGLLRAVVGTGLVAFGASAWNQVLERGHDALMRRTRNRPIPSGRMSAFEAALLGSLLCAAGLGILLAGGDPLAAWVALATFVLYVGVYTPLKTVTTLNTAVGAIPGALPPVIGWCAAGGGLGPEAIALFLILYLWQFPHFLAIAWLYREDYQLGGLRMLPVVDPTGASTGRQSALHALVLIPATVLPVQLGMVGSFYLAVGLAASAWYFVNALRFARAVTERNARRLLYASFVHLPVVLLLLVLDS